MRIKTYAFFIGLVFLVVIINLYINNFALSEAFIKLQSKTNYFIHCDLDDCKMYVFKDYQLIKKYPIAGGKDDARSPYGSWIITDKSTWGKGFGGHWLGLNIPWGRYGIHGTSKPGSIGSNVSHGCIRMYSKDAEALFNMIPHGTRVTITQGLYGPFGAYYKTIKSGDRGSDVYAIQARLKNLGYFNGYVNGIYGKDTEFAINKFQKANKLPIINRITKAEYAKLGFIRFE